MEAAGDLQQTAMASSVFREDKDLSYPPRDMEVIFKSVQILSGLPSVTTAFTVLLGLIYELNLQYHQESRSTSEVAQKIIKGLKTSKVTVKRVKKHSIYYSALQCAW